MSPKNEQTGDSPQELLESPMAFVELMALKQLDAPRSSNPDETEKVERFQSLAAPFAPGEGSRAFGGHVYAQSTYAASKTVPKGFVIHDVTGSFIRGGLLDVPYVYTVRHIRDGGMYCTRGVDARQRGKICFSCLCSFKRDERQQKFHHQPIPAQERFKSLLDGIRPEDHPPSPSLDSDWWMQMAEEGNFSVRDFPGLHVRKVDMTDYNLRDEVKQSPDKFRQLTVYSLKGDPAGSGSLSREELKEKDQSGEFDNLYACAHMYSSDKNSLLLIPRSLGIKNWSEMASLTLTVVFHQHGDALRMIDWDAASKGDGEGLPKKWFIQEGWTPTSGENRAIHESYLWDPEGRLLATSYQDSLLRLGKLTREEKL